eukprot:4099709-Lingulodinium_polyedra.AAC.1
MARISSPSLTGAALEQARGPDISFLFDGVVYSEPDFPAKLFGGRARSDAEGPALDVIDPYMDSV